MLTTLVEEFDTNTAFQVNTHSAVSDEGFTRIGNDAIVNSTQFDDRSGSIRIEELHMSIVWWTSKSDARVQASRAYHSSCSHAAEHDAHSSDVHGSAVPMLHSSVCFINLMAVSDRTDQHVSQRTPLSQMLSVPIPACALEEGILTCGVVRQCVRTNTMVITWLTHSLKATHVSVTFQRQSSSAGAILFTVEGAAVTSQPIHANHALFDPRHDTGASRSKVTEYRRGSTAMHTASLNTRHHISSSTSSSYHQQPTALQACVLSEVASTEEVSVVAVYVLTDGISLCSARVHANGVVATQEVVLVDNNSSNYFACRDQVASVCGDLLDSAATVPNAVLSSMLDEPHANGAYHHTAQISNKDNGAVINDEDGANISKDRRACVQSAPAVVEVSRLMDYVQHQSAGFNDSRSNSNSNNSNDPAAHTGTGNEESQSGWVSRWLPWRRQSSHSSLPAAASSDASDQGVGQYLAINAVHNTPYAALQRRNGLLEFYTSAWTPVYDIPTLFLPLHRLTQHDAHSQKQNCSADPRRGFSDIANQVQMVQQHVSFSKDGECVHVVTAVSCRGYRHCYWSLLPLNASSHTRCKTSPSSRGTGTSNREVEKKNDRSRYALHRCRAGDRDEADNAAFFQSATAAEGASSAHTHNIAGQGDTNNNNGSSASSSSYTNSGVRDRRVHAYDGSVAKERIALHCTYAFSAPTPTASPRCCALSAVRGELLVLWSSGTTHQQPLCNSDNLALLTQSAAAPMSHAHPAPRLAQEGGMCSYTFYAPTVLQMDGCSGAIRVPLCAAAAIVVVIARDERTPKVA